MSIHCIVKLSGVRVGAGLGRRYVFWMTMLQHGLIHCVNDLFTELIVFVFSGFSLIAVCTATARRSAAVLTFESACGRAYD
jgi:hypothetical protein